MPERFAISAGTVVPMNAPPVIDGAVIVSNSHIENIVNRSDLPDDIPFEHYPDCILMPALVNAHTHLVLSAFRGLADNADFFTWLTEHVIGLNIDTREDECRESVLFGINECFRHGITSLGEHHYTTWGFDAMRDRGMKGVYYYEVFGYGTLDLSGSVEKNRRVIEKLIQSSTPELRIGIAPHAPYTVTPPMAEMIVNVARKHDLPITTHIAETREEMEFFLRGEGRFSNPRRSARFPKPDGVRTSVKYFEELEILTRNTLLIHGIYLTDSDIDIISSHGCPISVCPTSNLKLGVGMARVDKLMDHGIPVCIATDSLASGETFDLFEEMRRMVLYQRGVTGNTDKLSSEKVVQMITVNPARALGIEKKVGDLRSGSCADLLLIEPDVHRVKNNRTVYDNILWDTKSSDIVKVWADGSEVYSR